MIWVIGGCIWFAISIVVGLWAGKAISFWQEADDYESF